MLVNSLSKWNAQHHPSFVSTPWSKVASTFVGDVEGSPFWTGLPNACLSGHCSTTRSELGFSSSVFSVLTVRTTWCRFEQNRLVKSTTTLCLYVSLASQIHVSGSRQCLFRWWFWLRFLRDVGTTWLSHLEQAQHKKNTFWFTEQNKRFFKLQKRSGGLFTKLLLDGFKVYFGNRIENMKNLLSLFKAFVFDGPFCLFRLSSCLIVKIDFNSCGGFVIRGIIGKRWCESTKLKKEFGLRCSKTDHVLLIINWPKMMILRVLIKKKQFFF